MSSIELRIARALAYSKSHLTLNFKDRYAKSWRICSVHHITSRSTKNKATKQLVHVVFKACTYLSAASEPMVCQPTSSCQRPTRLQRSQHIAQSKVQETTDDGTVMSRTCPSLQFG
jgi:hypothetical protein